MSLRLPADIEPHLPEGVTWNQPGVYALRLQKPDDVQEAWDEEFDHRPDYMDELNEKPRTMYVGASKNVVGRLEDHQDGKLRKAALLRVCTIKGLEGVWWFDTATEAFNQEFNIASALQTLNRDTYVHQR